jgi:hypothetical protein
MDGVWVARMESESYSWTAVGKTEEEAINAIAKEWNKGKGCVRRDPMNVDELGEYYGIYCEFIKFGECDFV